MINAEDFVKANFEQIEWRGKWGSLNGFEIRRYCVMTYCIWWKGDFHRLSVELSDRMMSSTRSSGEITGEWAAEEELSDKQAEIDFVSAAATHYGISHKKVVYEEEAWGLYWYIGKKGPMTAESVVDRMREKAKVEPAKNLVYETY